MADLLNDLLEKSKSTDRLALLKAKEAAKKKMGSDPKPGDIAVFKKTQAELEKSGPAPLPGLIFPTQLEAVEYLNGQGYKLGKSKFNADLKKYQISELPGGGFEASALLGYARAHCQLHGRAVDQAAENANLERTKADAENKRLMAERNRLKLERERGNLMPRDEHETELAARAAFFKREVETFGRRLGPRFIHLVGGDENRLPAFLEFYKEQSEIWMDAWSKDRVFIVTDNDDETAGPDEEKPGRPILFDDDEQFETDEGMFESV